MLTVFSTHFKVGWLQRNGVAHSDAATMTEHFIRHGDYLTVVSIVNDPIYLEEPFIRSTDFVLNLGQEVTRTQFDVVDEVAGRRKGYVPHYLPDSPGARLKLTEFASRSGVPPEAARGGAETTYPDYQIKLRQWTASPARRAGRPSERPVPSSTADSNRAAEKPEMQVVPVQGNVYMLVGAGGNVAIQVGNEGVLLVDTGAAPAADAVLAAIRRLTDKPIRIIINTHAHPDHVGGNESLAKAGKWLGGNAPGNFGLPTLDARVIAHEQVLTKMSAPTGRQAPLPFGAWPTETFFGEDKEIFFNDEAIQLLHQPSAHTAGDLVVFFRRSDVVSTGDVFLTTTYPVIDRQNGGSIQGVIDALNRVLDVMIPKDKEEGGTYAIPGHGRLCDEADVVEYRDMLTIVRDRVQSLIVRGMSLDQVKIARPTRDYDGRYGAATGPWTTEMFVEAVYRDLSGRR
jgi:glyoxylase-like metal-dependent hydrolase (beta-lactamase superfamily II)